MEQARERMAQSGSALDYLVGLAAEWVGAPVSRLSLLDDEQQLSVAAHGLTGPAAAPVLPRSKALCDLTVRAGQPVEIDDLADEDPRSALLAGARQAGLGAYLGVPVHFDGFVVGSLCAMDAEAHRWTRRDREALVRLSHIVEGLIDHRAEVVPAEVVGAMRLDADLRVLALTGRRGPAGRTDLVGRHLQDFVPLGVWQQAQSSLEAAASGETVDFVVHWPGEPAPWPMRAQPTQGCEGSRPGLLLTRQDAAPEAPSRPGRLVEPCSLSEAQDALGNPLLGLLEEGVVVFDARGKLRAINPSAQRMLDVEEAEALASDDWRARKIVRAPDGTPRPMGQRGLDRVLRDGRPVLGEVLVIEREHGSSIVLRLNAVPLTDPDGRILGAALSMADVTQQQAAEDAARALAERDPLTALPNRLLLTRRLEAEMVLAQATERSLTLLSIDVDGLKAVNDLHGHVHGDAYLRAIADRLRSQVDPGGLVARIAGDEFVVLLPAVGAEAPATALAEGVLEAVRRPLEVNGVLHHPRCSIGLVVTDERQLTATDVLGDADVAMYSAKASGGQAVRRFTPSMRTAEAERLQVERELRVAVAGDELCLHFQPIWSAQDETLMAFEALVRWQHPQRDWIGPCDFIPVAERSELILEVGRWVLREACGQLVAWRAAHGPDAMVPVQVNLAAAQLRDASLPAQIADLLTEHELPAALLSVELTETMVMTPDGAVRATVAAISALGVRISLDDFGTGYSSLRHLVDLPIDTLKIDRSFVSGLCDEAQRDALLGGVCDLARRLGLQTVAEGIETPEQAALLRGFGCDRLQGYLLGRPMDPDSAATLIS